MDDRGRKTRRGPAEPGRPAGAPNYVWVTDFTYAPVHSGFVYVALVIDLYSRAIVGWGNLTVKDTEFEEQRLKMALWCRNLANRAVGTGSFTTAIMPARSTPRFVTRRLSRSRV